MQADAARRRHSRPKPDTILLWALKAVSTSMSLFGRETRAEQDRAERFGRWARARTPFAIFSGLFGILAVLDAFTILIGLTAGAAAIVLGVIGLRDLERRQSLLGRRLCYTGIVLGAAGISLSIIIWTVVYPMIDRTSPG